MIEVNDVSKFYGVKNAVDHLSLRVQKGDVLGLIGPNGAGKTTTMKMICGVIPVYSGSVSLAGFDIMKYPERQKSHLGYLPENAPLYTNMTVKSWLKFTAAMHGISSNEIAGKVRLAAERCSLLSVMDEEIDSLSKGYKRRVSLAQAIIHEPEILILDEPTDGLDPIQKREIRNFISYLRSTTAIIISTHILEEVEAVCSRVALLVHGRKMFDDITENFRRKAEQMNVFCMNVLPADVTRAFSVYQKEFGIRLKLVGDEFRFCCSESDMSLQDISLRIKSIAENNHVKITSEIRKNEVLPDDIFTNLTWEYEKEISR